MQNNRTINKELKKGDIINCNWCGFMVISSCQIDLILSHAIASLVYKGGNIDITFRIL